MHSTTEEKIIKAAISEFASFGFAGARMDRIAASAGVNKAMIYYHFKDKEKLYESILAFHAERIGASIVEVVPDGKADLEKIYSIISKLIENLDKFDPDIIRIILMELSSGGKYIRKIIYPKLIHPVSALLGAGFVREIDNKTIRPLNPYHTIIQVFGGVLYFNIARIALQGTELYDRIYSDNYLEKFRDNLISILKHGIESGEGGK